MKRMLKVMFFVELELLLPNPMWFDLWQLDCFESGGKRSDFD